MWRPFMLSRCRRPVALPARGRTGFAFLHSPRLRQRAALPTVTQVFGREHIGHRAFFASSIDQSGAERDADARKALEFFDEDEDDSLDPEDAFDDIFNAEPYDDEVAALLSDEPPAFPAMEASADPVISVAKSKRGRSSTAKKKASAPQPVRSESHAESLSVDGPVDDNRASKSGQDNLASDPPTAATEKQHRYVAALETKLQALTDEITAQNNDAAFNVNSPKQVADVLYGPAPAQTGDAARPSRPTGKEVLEGMAAAGNRMADLILQYRTFSRQLRKEKERVQHRSQGNYVYDLTRPSANRTRTGNQTLPLDNNKNATISQMEDPLLIVDASAFIFRAYYSMPPLHRADGMPVGAVLGFCNMLNRIVLDRAIQETALGSDQQPRIVLVFDSKDADTFRQTMYPEYKANRSPCPMDLEPQFALVKNAAKAYGILRVEAPTFEADDVIATLATRAMNDGLDVCILSSDKDLMQLVTDASVVPRIEMFDPMNLIRISPDVIEAKWGVSPDKLGDVLALAGDTADNIPGVPGIGPKSAAKLINEFGSLEELLSQLDSVKRKGWRQKLEEHQETARLSRKLVELEREIPHETLVCSRKFASTTDIQMKPLDQDRLMRFYDNIGLGDIKRRVTGRLKRSGLLLSDEERQKRSREELESIFYNDHSDDEDD